MTNPIDAASQPSAATPDYGETATKLTDEIKKSTRTVLDIAYGEHERQKLDIYLPDVSVGSMPVLIFIHGGYWALGTKDRMGFMAPSITRLPAIYVSIGYRLTPEARFPQPVDDCRAALKWVYDNIGQHGGDPERIFIGGHSAGGHLAAMVTLQRDELAKAGLPSDVIKGCFPVSGVYDVWDSPPERRDPFVGSIEEAKEASPTSHVEGNSVPFFIVIGENDFPNLRDQYPKLVDRLKAQPGHVEAVELPGVDHFEISLANGDANGVWAVKVREWMANPPKPSMV